MWPVAEHSPENEVNSTEAYNEWANKAKKQEENSKNVRKMR